MDNTEFLTAAKHLIMKLQKNSPLTANLTELETTILSLKDKGKQQSFFFSLPNDPLTIGIGSHYKQNKGPNIIP